MAHRPAPRGSASPDMHGRPLDRPRVYMANPTAPPAQAYLELRQPQPVLPSVSSAIRRARKASALKVLPTTPVRIRVTLFTAPTRPPARASASTARSAALPTPAMPATSPTPRRLRIGASTRPPP